MVEWITTLTYYHSALYIKALGWESYSSWDMHVAHLLFCAKLVVIGSTLNYLMDMGDKKLDLFNLERALTCRVCVHSNLQDTGVHALANTCHVDVERRSKRRPGEVVIA